MEISAASMIVPVRVRNPALERLVTQLFKLGAREHPELDQVLQDGSAESDLLKRMITEDGLPVGVQFLTDDLDLLASTIWKVAAICRDFKEITGKIAMLTLLTLNVQGLNRDSMMSVAFKRNKEIVDLSQALRGFALSIGNTPFVPKAVRIQVPDHGFHPGSEFVTFSADPLSM